MNLMEERRHKELMRFKSKEAKRLALEAAVRELLELGFEMTDALIQIKVENLRKAYKELSE